jgi:phage baseplate assembly protein W
MNVRKKTYGINFPFLDSNNGDFLSLTQTPESEIKANLVHLLLTRRGSRYYLPEFGTNIYQYIFEIITEDLLSKIENEIINACERFIPNLTINKINIETYDNDIDYVSDYNKQASIKIGIDYTINSRTFQSSDSVTIV